MNLYIFQSRYPISQATQKKISDILHNTYQRYTDHGAELSAMLREKGFPESNDYDYVVKRSVGSCFALENIELFSESCRTQLSELLDTKKDRILFLLDKANNR